MLLLNITNFNGQDMFFESRTKYYLGRSYILNSEMEQEQGGGQRKRYKDPLKATFKIFYIQPSNWEKNLPPRIEEI